MPGDTARQDLVALRDLVVHVVLLEVPSGVLADATSRRVLLAVAPLLTAAGYALWILAPS